MRRFWQLWAKSGKSTNAALSKKKKKCVYLGQIKVTPRNCLFCVKLKSLNHNLQNSVSTRYPELNLSAYKHLWVILDSNQATS